MHFKLKSALTLNINFTKEVFLMFVLINFRSLKQIDKVTNLSGRVSVLFVLLLLSQRPRGFNRVLLQCSRRLFTCFLVSKGLSLLKDSSVNITFLKVDFIQFYFSLINYFVRSYRSGLNLPKKHNFSFTCISSGQVLFSHPFSMPERTVMH